MPSFFQVGHRPIGLPYPTFIIAEIGINHNGDLLLAKKLVDQAVAAGADCAKFQMRSLAHLYANAGNPNDAREDLGSQYVLEVINRAQLSPDEMIQVFDYCKTRGIRPLCTPWDVESAQLLMDYGMEAYKIASADLTNHDLIRLVAGSGRPIILSTGMSTEEEIREAVDVLRSSGVPYALLHCVSSYPAPFKDIHLPFLHKLGQIGECPVGYSGHERGYHIPLAAVAMGARIIEKHLTLDRSMVGNDHKVSLECDAFSAMVRAIRDLEQALVPVKKRRVSQGEWMNREHLAKSLAASRPLSVGERISADKLMVRSPGKGLQPNRRSDLIGRKARRPFDRGDFFFPSDLQEESGARPRAFAFRRPWGLPVRFHDFQALLARSNMDFVEFHLSYKDLEIDPASIFDDPLELGFFVHSPDLFSEDHILNLAADDGSYRQRSVRELQRVIDLTRTLKAFFPQTFRPHIIASLGGFTRDSPLAVDERFRLYDRVAESLRQLDAEGVELLAQTLPPFPWYLGGQLYCNLFVDPEDTAWFCREHGYGLCLDVSHSALAMNHSGKPLAELVDRLAPFTRHLHLVDAAGVDGEGLQIGEGTIDFPALAEQLDRLAPAAGFIPEIWQGHKNGGEGFWTALDRLEVWF